MKRPFIYALIIIAGCILAAVLYSEATDNVDKLHDYADDLRDYIEYAVTPEEYMIYKIYKGVAD